MSSLFKHPEELVESPYYNEDFSVDINRKMTVPNQIKAVEGGYTTTVEDPAIMIQDPKDSAGMMRVPDCIRVAGGESHITTTREPPFEIKLEEKLFGKPNDESLIQLTTPPRTLRYEDAVPIFAEPIKQLDRALNTSSQYIKNRACLDGSMMKMSDTTLIEYHEGDQQLTSQNFIQLRRRILQLSHRIDSLEIENRHRNRRDLLIYALGALYLLFRGLSWFASSGTSGRRGFTL